MSYPSSAEFRKHSQNFAAVKAELTQIELLHKQSIRAGKEPEIRSMRRTHTLYLGIYAEAKLRKILSDPTGFNESEREALWHVSDQYSRWVSAVQLAFRRHYSVLFHLPLNEYTLGVSVSSRADQVIQLLAEYVKPVIEVRNKLAHGQWVWQLKSRSEGQFVQNSTNYDSNYTTTVSTHAVIETVGNLVHILAVSEPTFDRDYDSLMKQLDAARSGLDGQSYGDFVKELRGRRRSSSSSANQARPTQVSSSDS